MAIDAEIVDVIANRNGTATLRLTGAPRELVVTNPPKENFDAVVGTKITGDANWLYVGSIAWARRLDNVRVRLLPKGTKP